MASTSSCSELPCASIVTTAPAKSSDIESLRALHNARRSAVKARQAAQVQIRALLATAPVNLREKYRGRTSLRLVRALAIARPTMYADPGCRGVLTALKALARRHQHLTDEIIAVARAQQSFEALRALRVPVAYREYEMGHEINAESLTDLAQWLDDKVRSPIILV